MVLICIFQWRTQGAAADFLLQYGHIIMLLREILARCCVKQQDAFPRCVLYRFFPSGISSGLGNQSYPREI